MFSINKRKHSWKNWAGTVYNHPGTVYYPSSVEEVRQILKMCHQRRQSLRVLGTGHSFTPLAAADDVLMSLDHLSGLIEMDHTNSRAFVWAGTRLDVLGDLLYEQGYAMENLGDINAQSIAGAISTGTHGTGAAFGSLSTQVHRLTLVTPGGDILNVSPEENSDLFQAASLSLGMMGVIVAVELNVIASHFLLADSYTTGFDDCLNNLNQLRHNNRNFEFYWFVHTNTIQVKLMNKPADQDFNRPIKRSNDLSALAVENGGLWMLSELCRSIPSAAKAASSISAKAVPTGKKLGNSHNIYATPRLVKFREMEYAIPAEWMEPALRDIKQITDKHGFHVHFPIENRFVRGDDIWLSPAYQRDSAYIAVHMYKGMAFQSYFDAIENIFRRYEGRPHWAKMHSMTAADLRVIYPQLPAFLNIRSELDPRNILLNGYLRQLFDI